VYRAGKAMAVISKAGLALFDGPAWALATSTILVKVIFVTIMSYRNFSGISFYYIF
jgi:hypothetical protein